ncbi:hypothetical protein H0H87_011455 [Tephrocybe sp. NHM501043]|nr:hypothetical protein H0H87_011455 [Tephrocybe sp. NHM501043]
MDPTRSPYSPPLRPQRLHRALASPGSPSLPSRKILVVVTVDAERYTPVDLTDALDQGSVIRTRILHKLGIHDEDEQTRALIFETEIGSMHIGHPLDDQSLSALCRERGDSRASLAFIVDRRPPLPSRPSHLQTPPLTADSITNGSFGDLARQQRQRNRSQTINEQILSSNGHRPDGLVRSPPHRTTRPTDISIESNNPAVTDEPQPRRVRPLPAIPTPTSTPNSGNSMVGDPPYPSIHDINNDTHDLYDSARRLQISHTSSRGQTLAIQTTDIPPEQPLVPLPKPPVRISSAGSGNSSGSSPAPAPIPFTYVRGELIGGNGSDSRVYLALDSSQRIIAVKQKDIPKGPELSESLATQARHSFLEALRAESELLQTLEHKNIVKHIFFQENEKTVNIFMEYVPGGTLRGILDAIGPFPDNATKYLTGQILDGLAYLHSHHILHRDLRAESILVQEDGTCKISDFVVSKFANDKGLVYTALQGSTFWMAPEVINTKTHGGGYTTKVDIWSLGCLVIEMWSSHGGRPWTGLEASKVMKRLSDSLPPPLPEGHKLTPSARDFYDRCFTINPIARPSALKLKEHPYLLLPPDWIFSLSVRDITPIANRPPTPTDTPGPSNIVVNKFPPEYTLHGFPRYSSPKSPVKWLEENRSELVEYIRQSKFQLFARTECMNWANSSLLFPRLVIFSYEAVYDLQALQAAVEIWKSWDPITAMVHYQEVNDILRSFYDNMEEVNGLKGIVALDVDAICARLYVHLQSENGYRTIVGLKDVKAQQSMLDLLQMLLDLPALDVSFRSRFMNALLDLSKRSGLYPGLLLQRKVTLEGTYAIASGQFGDVWKGKFQSQQVAVKVLKIYSRSDLRKHVKKVLRETLIWRQLRHSNVLPFICLHHVQGNAERIALVSPWMDNGNLQEFLQQTSNADRVSLMQDVAEGLAYLHAMKPSIVHGDLKAANVLITDTHRACLADFGLSTASKSQAFVLTSDSSGQVGGTSRWTAPELLNGTQVTNTVMSDVYSFGCVCFEYSPMLTTTMSPFSIVLALLSFTLSPSDLKLVLFSAFTLNIARIELLHSVPYPSFRPAALLKPICPAFPDPSSPGPLGYYVALVFAAAPVGALLLSFQHPQRAGRRHDAKRLGLIIKHSTRTTVLSRTVSIFFNLATRHSLSALEPLPARAFVSSALNFAPPARIGG